MFFRWWTRSIWGAVIAACALIAWNSAPYFFNDPSAPFFTERPELTDGRVWRALLVTHVAGGVVSLALGPVLVWNLAFRKSPALHRWLGWGYVTAVLGWAAPSGLLLSLTAKGGAWGASGFFLTGLLWLVTTGKGLSAIRKRQLTRHAEWMLRSYAVALSALFFRVIYPAFYFVDVSPQTGYVVSLWLSLIASLMLGESFVAQLRRFDQIRSFSLFSSRSPWVSRV